MFKKRVVDSFQQSNWQKTSLKSQNKLSLVYKYTSIECTANYGSGFPSFFFT